MNGMDNSSGKRIELKVGDPAPDFTLQTHNEGELNLAWYQGRKNVVLAFYPGDWTPVCSNQIPGYQVIIDQFENLDCQLLAISVDSVPCHRAWAKSLGGLTYPLMADYWPHGHVASLYGAMTNNGYSERAVILIDKKGIIRWIDRVDLAREPDNEALLEQLRKLQAK